MKSPTLFRIVALCLLLTSGGCRSGGDSGPIAKSDDAVLAMLFAAGGGLVGAPNLYEVLVQASDGSALVRRSGELPAEGQLVQIDRLPAVAGAIIDMNLFSKSYQNRTHQCHGTGPVDLVSGATASITIQCVATIDPSKNKLDVFLRVAKASLAVEQLDTATLIAAKDFTGDAVYAFTDSRGRRVSLKQAAGSLILNIGGEISYIYTNAKETSPLVQLLTGESLPMTVIGGRMLLANPDAGTLQLSTTVKPTLFEKSAQKSIEATDYGVALPIEFRSATQNVTVTGSLLEEEPNAEFTIAAYNVENLFDQVDDARNQGYGDYRIAANSRGQVSNYGAPVEFNGALRSFTDVKIAGIRRALLGIDVMNGPSIIGLEEIESPLAMQQLFEAVRDLGYTQVLFSAQDPANIPTAVGVGLLTKFPILSWSLVQPENPPLPTPDVEPLRAILRADLDVYGHTLTVYVNHWKSKGGPESQRKACAEALQRDIDALIAANPRADYIVMGDLNSEYNEKVVLEERHNDTEGVTGINDILKAQGDELAVLRNTDPAAKYNLHFELERGARRSAWYSEFGWSGLDHMIVSSGLYDQTGVTYVDNSFQIATPQMPTLGFLFNGETPNRWQQRRVGQVTTHFVGGFSDHLPIFARFRVAARQSAGTIYLDGPGRPDQPDVVLRAAP